MTASAVTPRGAPSFAYKQVYMETRPDAQSRAYISEFFHGMQATERAIENESLSKRSVVLLQSVKQRKLPKFKAMMIAEETIAQLFSLAQSSLKEARKGLAEMQQFPDPYIQEKAIKALAFLLSAQTLSYDVEYRQTEELLDLEKQVNSAIESCVRIGGPKDVLLSFLRLYEDILEHLWLLPYLQEDQSVRAITVKQNTPLIATRNAQWLGLLAKPLTQDKDVIGTLVSIQKASQRIGASLPPQVRKKIDQVKSVIKRDLLAGVLGDFYVATQDYRRSIHHYHWCIDLLVPRMNQQRVNPKLNSLVGKLMANLGDDYFSLGDFSSAIKYYKQCLTNVKTLEDQTITGVAYGKLGNAYQSLGKYGKAKKKHKKSLTIAQTFADHPGEGTAHGNLGITYNALGAYRKAIIHHEQALAIAQKLKNQELEGAAFQNLGITHNRLGEYLKAIQLCRQAFAIATGIGNDMGKGKIYQTLGVVYQSLGKYRVAIRYHKNALAIATKLGDQAGEGKSYGNLGSAFFFQGQYRKAIGYFTKALDIAKVIGDQTGVGKSYGNLGNVFLLQKKSNRAIGYHKNALAIATKIGDQVLKGQAYVNLGLAYYSQETYAAAIDQFTKAITVFADLQKMLGDNNQWKITIFEEQSTAYLELEKVLLHQRQTNQALETTDLRRSRALVDVFLRKASQSSAAPIQEPITCSQILSFAVQLNTTFLVYSLATLSNEATTIGVWITSPKGEVAYKPLSIEPIAGDIKDVADLFKGFPFNRARGEMEVSSAPQLPTIPVLQEIQELTRGSSRDKARKRAVLERFQIRLKDWYNVFIAPIEEHLPKDPKQTITIIPDGFLSQLPFAAFRDAEGTYLIEKHPIAFAPSIKTLQLLEQKSRAMQLPQASLIVGNPRTPNPDDVLTLAQEEAYNVAIILSAQPEQVLVQEKAKVHRILEGAQDARWIHLACHGEAGYKFDPHSVFEGRLKLAPDENHKEGHLYAQEIAGLHLNAELVFMSACYSGTGKLQREGSIGHIWSFLAAGALSTVATYWPLSENKLTVQMVNDFYQHILGEDGQRLNKAQALQQTMLKAITDERERPDLWGAFFLSGLT